MQVWHDASMDLRRLRHLISVAEHGNFGRAAAASYITQPALSRSIQALEAEVGAPLLDRLPTGVEPTDMGRLLLRHARALDAGHAISTERSAWLREWTSVSSESVSAPGGAALVAPVIGRLHAQHPRLRLRVLVPGTLAATPSPPTAREVDIVVGALGEIEPLEEFAVDAVSDHHLVVVGRGRHPLPEPPERPCETSSRTRSSDRRRTTRRPTRSSRWSSTNDKPPPATTDRRRDLHDRV